jgi:transposase
MPRYTLTEELWFKLRETLLQFSLYNKAGLRKTVEGILFRMRTGIPWRDLPEHFSKWNSIYKAFNHWSKKGLWKKPFNVLRTASDLEWVSKNTTVRRYAAPESPFAQPSYVLFGSMLPAGIGAACYQLLGATPLSMSLAVSLSVLGRCLVSA